MSSQSLNTFWLAPFENRGFTTSPSAWTTQDFIAEIQAWPRLPIVLTHSGEKEYLGKLKAHYQNLSTWLEYSLVEMDASEREKLRLIIHFSNCVIAKPDADFSLAIREMCRQVYGKSELLTQSPSYEHLWFLVEYSNCLQMMKHPGLLTGIPTTREDGKVISKGDVQSDNANSIKIYKQALRNGFSKKNASGLETEEIPPEEDWREHFLNILIAEAVKTAIENQDQDLKQHCMQFLNAFSYYNRDPETSKHQLWHLIDGQLSESIPGRKSKQMLSAKRKRDIGRPIGSRNQKGV